MGSDEKQEVSKSLGTWYSVTGVKIEKSLNTCLLVFKEESESMVSSLFANFANFVPEAGTCAKIFLTYSRALWEGPYRFWS